MVRQRAGSRLSFRKSSSSSVSRVEATESPQEKAKFHLNTKADPSKAINEAQPVDVANAQPTTSTSIRDIEHRDYDGNIIVDPDRSNPTRPRLERPLDTIRSFEAAIDGSYNKRQSFRAETPISLGSQTRRSSYVNGYQSHRRGGQNIGDGGGGYYSTVMNNNRLDSYYENGTTPGTPYHGSGNRRFGQRNTSDPALYGNSVQQGVCPSHGHQQSYDTVGTLSSGSHITDQWGNSTDPSSENSSLDRVQPAPKPDLGEAYGLIGFGGAPQFQGPIFEEHGQGSPSYGQSGYGQTQMSDGNSYLPRGNAMPPPVLPHGAPMVPSKERAPAKAPIRLSATKTIVNRGSSGPSPPSKNEKRRSWLGKRFSRG